MEEVNKPKVMVGVLGMIGHLISLVMLKKNQLTYRSKLRVQMQALTYIMGDFSGLGFGLLI